MEETKTVYMLISYQAEVPSDMPMDKIIDAIHQMFEYDQDKESISVEIKDEEVYFRQDGISFGTGFQLMMEGDK